MKAVSISPRQSQIRQHSYSSPEICFSDEFYVHLRTEAGIAALTGLKSCPNPTILNPS